MQAEKLKGVFPSCYLPTVEYLMLLHRFNEVSIDIGEPYCKQSLRNRCFILSPNGVQMLTVPVIFHSLQNPSVKTIEISYAEPWQKQHLGAIKAAYGRSPWFEFIYDDVAQILNTRFTCLFQLNQSLLDFVLKRIKSPVHFTPFEEQCYEMYMLGDAKTSEPVFVNDLKPYNQVFRDRFGFTRNLTCIDLLFNTGHDTMKWLL
jgi:hypothetical protein